MTPEPAMKNDDLVRLLSDLEESLPENLSPDELDQLVESLAYAETDLVEPRMELRDKVLQNLLPQVEREDGREKLRNSIWLPWAAVLVAGGLAILLWVQKEEATGLAELQMQKIEALTSEVTILREKRELDRLKIVAMQSEQSADYFGAAVWDAGAEEGILKVAQIPKLDPDKDYQLWIVDPAYETPVDGGVFQVDQNGAATIVFKPRQTVEKATAFAVSLERKGGVPVAEGPMVLIGGI